MRQVLNRAVTADSSGARMVAGDSERAACFHCGTPVRGEYYRREDKAFCCHGCLTVFELLSENGLTEFYQLADTAGVRVKADAGADRFKYLDERIVRERLVDFSDEKVTRVTFRIPAIHCIACVWLLENLFRLNVGEQTPGEGTRPANGIGESRVNFPRKELSLSFDPSRVQLSEVVSLLARLGYEPELKLSDLETARRSPVSRQLWLQLGYAGFAFGNLMLFSIATYFGLDAFSGPAFGKLVGWISLVLALPVVTYSALHYWRTAWTSLRQRRLAIEVPIAAGILAIFFQSAGEVITGSGAGYFDSLCGLIFFLLCGRLFQQKTYERLSFERDYKSFFPLSITRKTGGAEDHVSLSQVRVGDTLLIRNGELIPADARLRNGAAMIDYSFVTGESEPVVKIEGDYLYAGGRQIGAAIEIETLKPVSQSYLTSLWNQEAFRKDKTASFQTLINAFSYRFTLLVISIAAGAAVFWMLRGESARAFKAFVSVLIVACPCALALASPFALGTAIRLLGRRNIFVKSPEVVEAMAQVDSIVFDKTGTLTAAGAGAITFDGEPLLEAERLAIGSLARHSSHPLSVRIGAALRGESEAPVRSFREHAGRGIEGVVSGRELRMGSREWISSLGIAVPAANRSTGSSVYVAIDGQYRGVFLLSSALRADADKLIARLSSSYALTLLSGDNATERERFASLFGDTARAQFNHSPLSKFEFVRNQQRSDRTVMMVGDGLNDAGALKQSDVGVAVVETISAFSPASDVIMSAEMLGKLDDVLAFSRRTVRIVRAAFVISSLYNVVGVSIAAAGLLAPVVCAILMPLSSITVVAFASGTTTLAARRLRKRDTQYELRNTNP